MVRDVKDPTCCPTQTRPKTVINQRAVGTTREVDQSARVLIPAGKGTLGTAHPVILEDGEGVVGHRMLRRFAMDACAVSNARFAAFVDATGYQTQAEIFGDSFVFKGHLGEQFQASGHAAGASWWLMIKGASWRCPLGPESTLESTLDGLADHPVTHVTWTDAQAFAQWAGGRLPTEIEWEHAARGGLGDVAFPWGNKAPNDHSFFPANIWQGRFPDQNLALDGYAGTAPVKSYEPNGYGLYNMVGNTWEWTSQAFTPRTKSKVAAKIHAGKKGFKVVKGGSFMCHASYCFRYRIPARTATSPDSSTSHQGFRLVYDL